MERKQAKSPGKLAIGVLLIVAGIFALYSGISGLTDNRSRLFAPEGIITVEIVQSVEDRQLGLSGRESIGDEGMLFIFDDADARNCFWMKDMKFSIDMVWMDEDKRVLNTAADVAPETFPESFCPEGAAKYGLEVSSGGAEKLGLAVGETVRF